MDCDSVDIHREKNEAVDTIADSLNTIWKTWKGEIENMIARK